MRPSLSLVRVYVKRVAAAAGAGAAETARCFVTAVPAAAGAASAAASASSAARRVSPVAPDVSTAAADVSTAAADVSTAAADVSTAAAGVPTTAAGVSTAAAGVPTTAAGIPTAVAGVPSAAAGVPSAAASVPSAAAGLPTAAAGVAPAGAPGSACVAGGGCVASAAVAAEITATTTQVAGRVTGGAAVRGRIGRRDPTAAPAAGRIVPGTPTEAAGIFWGVTRISAGAAASAPPAGDSTVLGTSAAGARAALAAASARWGSSPFAAPAARLLPASSSYEWRSVAYTPGRLVLLQQAGGGQEEGSALTHARTRALASAAAATATAARATVATATAAATVALHRRSFAVWSPQQESGPHRVKCSKQQQPQQQRRELQRRGRFPTFPQHYSQLQQPVASHEQRRLAVLRQKQQRLVVVQLEGRFGVNKEQRSQVFLLQQQRRCCCISSWPHKQQQQVHRALKQPRQKRESCCFAAAAFFSSQACVHRPPKGTVPARLEQDQQQPAVSQPLEAVERQQPQLQSMRHFDKRSEPQPTGKRDQHREKPEWQQQHEQQEQQQPRPQAPGVDQPQQQLHQEHAELQELGSPSQQRPHKDLHAQASEQLTLVQQQQPLKQEPLQQPQQQWKQQEGQKNRRQQQEARPARFTFDPSLKVKTVRVSGLCDERDMLRSASTAKKFLSAGHRVELQLVAQPPHKKGVRAHATHLLLLLQRFLQFCSDISQPMNLPLTAAALEQQPVIRVMLCPCSVEQAAAYKVPPIVLDSKKHSAAGKAEQQRPRGARDAKGSSSRSSSIAKKTSRESSSLLSQQQQTLPPPAADYE